MTIPGVALTFLDEGLQLVQAQATDLKVVVLVAQVLVVEDSAGNGVRARTGVWVVACNSTKKPDTQTSVFCSADLHT